MIIFKEQQWNVGQCAGDDWRHRKEVCTQCESLCKWAGIYL